MGKGQTSQELELVVNQLGFRATNPRARVFQAISERGEGFTSQELTSQLSRVGRATVFRTIKLLVDIGAVCKVVMDDGSVRYRLSRPAHHHHLVCVRCGAAQDFAPCDTEEIVRKLEGFTGYRVMSHRMELYGLCQSCQGPSN